MVTVLAGKAVMGFNETKNDLKKHAEDAVVVFSVFAVFLNVLQPRPGEAEMAPRSLIFKEHLIDPGCPVG